MTSAVERLMGVADDSCVVCLQDLADDYLNFFLNDLCFRICASCLADFELVHEEGLTEAADRIGADVLDLLRPRMLQ
jgi:hypothetical protein